MKPQDHSIRRGAKPAMRSLAEVKAGPPKTEMVAKRPVLRRLILILLCVTSAAAVSAVVGAWGLTEFVLPSKLPPELVGKWVVNGGPQDGATFDFHRRGTMTAHLNDNGTEVVVEARASVVDRKLFTTTRNPHTRKDETSASKIQELTPNSLVLETDKGEVFRMTRAE
jgi:hypothetical protein